MSQRSYSHKRVQEYWQYVWEEAAAYELDGEVVDHPTYVLGMFPYTSGNLHMGHVRNYAITDAYARYRRMQGDAVLHPMGWDAFGLPAENAAHERFTDPASWTDACIDQMREEMKTLGFGYDWSREVTTCDPSYYRWNQYFFREFYEADLVEYKAAQVNWCPDCETALADAQVHERPAADERGAETDEHSPDREGSDGTIEVCWRCETPVGQRDLDQWFFTITDYAEELLDGLDDLEDWPESVREIQRNWIGKQTGVRVPFEVAGHGDVEVFTTRLDTICGATYLAVAPGHDLAEALAEEDDAVAAYLETVGEEDDAGTATFDGEEGDFGTATFDGVEIDATATHPVTGAELPVYVATYVLDDVGTGALMGVPAHNERDHAFASEHDLPIEQVIKPVDEASVDVSAKAYTAQGMLTNSGEYDGLASEAARERLLADLDDAEEAVTYRLRDWLISRQRYWGTPIPVVHCEDCGPVLVPEKELPIELPAFVQTRGNPLAEAEDFVETECPDCGGPAERETDTMDTFVDSSWYFLRFLDPDNDDAPFDPAVANDTLPVDVYVGGEEHAVLHLLYIRFFTRALADCGLLDVREPVQRLINQGTVLHGGEKMSKTKGNAISPHEYGAETTRLFVLAAAHPEQDFEWTARDVGSSYDLQQQLFDLVQSVDDVGFRQDRAPHDAYVEREIDRTIAAATEQYEKFRFHRVVTEIRGLLGLLGQYRDFESPHEEVYRRGLGVLARLVAPLTPYLAEEMWNLLRGEDIVATAAWPEPTHDVSEYAIERRVVGRLRDDVRDIYEVAGLAGAETIEVVIAPAWKYRAYDLARRADPDEALVGAIMDDEDLAAVGEPAREYAKSLQARQQQLPPVLEPDREYDLLDRARWLLADEFDADVSIRRASDAADDLAAQAKPGKPAIHID